MQGELLDPQEARKQIEIAVPGLFTTSNTFADLLRGPNVQFSPDISSLLQPALTPDFAMLATELPHTTDVGKIDSLALALVKDQYAWQLRLQLGLNDEVYTPAVSLAVTYLGWFHNVDEQKRGVPAGEISLHSDVYPQLGLSLYPLELKRFSLGTLKIDGIIGGEQERITWDELKSDETATKLSLGQMGYPIEYHQLEAGEGIFGVTVDIVGLDPMRLVVPTYLEEKLK